MLKLSNMNEKLEQYIKFIDEVYQKVCQEMGEGFKVNKCRAHKNNDNIRWGITIAKAHYLQTPILEPTIYLEEYYEAYVQGCELATIVQSIIDLYHQCINTFQIKEEEFSFEQIKDKICFMVVNREKNVANFVDRPNRPFLDLAVIYYVLYDRDASGISTIPVNYNLMRKWAVDEQTLWDLAYVNTTNIQTPVFRSLRVEESVGLEGENRAELYILTNISEHFGAASILYESGLSDLSNIFESSFYLLPASIHQCIVYISNDFTAKEQVDALVRRVSHSSIAEEEFLVDHAYYYDREQNRLIY